MKTIWIDIRIWIAKMFQLWNPEFVKIWTAQRTKQIRKKPVADRDSRFYRGHDTDLGMNQRIIRKLGVIESNVVSCVCRGKGGGLPAQERKRIKETTYFHHKQKFPFIMNKFNISFIPPSSKRKKRVKNRVTKGTTV